MSKYLYLLSKNQFKVIFFISAIVTILYMALTPLSKHPMLSFQYADKILHIIAFFVLSFLLNRSSSSIEKRLRNIFSLLTFGIFIEVLQSFTGYRTVSIGDILADLIGILLFQITYFFLKVWQLHRRKNRL